MSNPKIIVTERKLGREQAHGQITDIYDETGKPLGDLIEIDPRNTARQRLDTLLHELLHAVRPDWSESRVYRAANKMSRVMWADGWRRIQK